MYHFFTRIYLAHFKVLQISTVQLFPRCKRLGQTFCHLKQLVISTFDGKQKRAPTIFIFLKKFCVWGLNCYIFVIYFLCNLIKVRQIWDDFFKPTFLPKKNEQIRLYYLSTCFCSFFGGKWRHQKDISKSTDLYILQNSSEISSLNCGSRKRFR